MFEEDLEILRKNQRWGISNEEYLAARNELPASFSFTDVLMRAFNKQIKETDPRTDWGPLRCIYLCMGDALYKLERDTNRAIPYWFCAVLFDINCFIGTVLANEAAKAPVSDLPLYGIDDESYFLPTLIKYLRRDINRLERIQISKTVKPPFINWIYSNDDYASIISAIVNEDPFQFDKWNQFCAEKTRAFVDAYIKNKGVR